MRIGEHTGISRLTKKKVKPKGSAVSDHLLLCNHSPSFENFSSQEHCTNQVTIILMLTLLPNQVTGFELAVCNSQFAECFGSLRMSFCIFSKNCKSLKSDTS